MPNQIQMTREKIRELQAESDDLRAKMLVFKPQLDAHRKVILGHSTWHNPPTIDELREAHRIVLEAKSQYFPILEKHEKLSRKKNAIDARLKAMRLRLDDFVVQKAAKQSLVSV